MNQVTTSVSLCVVRLPDEQAGRLGGIAAAAGRPVLEAEFRPPSTKTK